MRKPEFLDKSLSDKDWIGIVTNNVDPYFSGRCQIRVLRLMDGIQSDHLPWAVPINSSIFAGDGAGSLSVPKIGHLVRVQFNHGDIYAPEYTAIQNVDTQLIEAIKDDYDGTHVLAFDPDEELNVIYQRNLGFQIYYRGSFIQIAPDSMITIQHANGDSLIQLEGDRCFVTTKNEVNISAGARVDVSADEVSAAGNQTTKIGPPPYSSAVLGETLFALLEAMAVIIDGKTPPTPSVTQNIVKQAKNAATSRNVLIGS